MRSEDWTMAIALRDHWNGKASGLRLCPLLADLDGMLAYMDQTGLKPGHVIDPCQACGQEHCWSFLSVLVEESLDLRLTMTQLQVLVDKKLQPVRARYGGPAAYRAMKKGSENFFAQVDAKAKS